MFDIHQVKIDFEKENEVLLKHINLDIDLECFILISSEDKKISGLVLSNILDTVIGNISKYDTYKDFSSALESINLFIKTWENDGNKIKHLNIFIGMLNKSNLMFSTIGNPSGYLIKKDGELIEITEKGGLKKEFSFISNGDIGDGEVIIISSNRLLDSLSKSDLRDSGSLHKSTDILTNMEQIIRGEKLDENVALFSIRNNFFFVPKEESNIGSFFMKCKYLGYKLIDTKFIKSSIANVLLFKEKLAGQNKTVKNVAFVGGILISVFLLYTVIGTLLSNSDSVQEIETSKMKLEEAKVFLRTANENIANPDIFNLNINSAETNIQEVQDKELFLNDIAKILDDIAIIKKQFNGVETYEEEPEKLVGGNLPKDAIKVIENGGKFYVITPTSVWGPILPEQEAKEYTFDKFTSSDKFVDALLFNGNILLLTTQSKIVTFTTNGYFRYTDALGQSTWEQIGQFESFGQNIYTIASSGKQIIKHVRNGENFSSGTPYLQEDDANSLVGIRSIAIDGGIYILKNDLSIIKIYGSPKYRVENIVINKLPDNYKLDNDTDPVKLKTRQELSYVYLYMNGKIWIFKPNSQNFQDTKNLTYIGQIEGKSKIKDFTIIHDGELAILSDNGLYKVNFEVSDNKIIIR